MPNLELLRPRDPVELAGPYAEQLSRYQGFDEFKRSELEEFTLGELNRAADSMRMLGETFFTSTGLGIISPYESEDDRELETRYFKLNGDITLEGNFCTFAIIKVGRVSQKFDSVRALCLTFDEALVLPYFEKVKPGHMLYVPALAVKDIAQTS
ncbi:MAG: hypothetical protein ACR2FM_05175 [Candidatus Saccharimonadales bacterium]